MNFRKCTCTVVLTIQFIKPKGTERAKGIDQTVNKYTIPIFMALATINIGQIKVLTCLLPASVEGSRLGAEKNE